MKENLSKLMKEQTDRFIALLIEEAIDVKDFYHISITPTKIRLQGDAKSESIDKYKEQGFKFSLDESSTMISAENDEIAIVFTF